MWGHLQGTRVILRRWKSRDLELSQIATLLIASGPCSSFAFCSQTSAQTVERIKGFSRGLRANFPESLILTSKNFQGKNCLCVHFCLCRKTKDFESVSKGWRVLPLGAQFSRISDAIFRPVCVNVFSHACVHLSVFVCVCLCLFVCWTLAEADVCFRWSHNFHPIFQKSYPMWNNFSLFVCCNLLHLLLVEHFKDYW